MKNVIFYLLLLCFLICSCGDSESPVTSQEIAEESSSSVLMVLSSAISTNVDVSSSSRKAVSSSSQGSSEKEKSSSSKKVSSSSELALSSIEKKPVESSSSEEALSSVVASSSSGFVVPESSVSSPVSLSFDSVYANVKESLLQNFLRLDSIELEYQFNYSGTYKYRYISNGPNRLYLYQSKDLAVLEQLKNGFATKVFGKTTENIVKDSVRKLVDVSNVDEYRKPVSYVLGISESFKDSLRANFVYGAIFNPLDSGNWNSPVQITDDIFEMENDLKYKAYYSLSNRRLELYTYFVVEDGGGADAEMRFVYDDEGYVKEIRIDILSHTDAGLSMRSTFLTEITKRKIGTVISEKLFDF